MKNNAYKLIALFPLLLVAFTPVKPITLSPGDTIYIDVNQCAHIETQTLHSGIMTIRCD